MQTQTHANTNDLLNNLSATPSLIISPPRERKTDVELHCSSDMKPKDLANAVEKMRKQNPTYQVKLILMPKADDYLSRKTQAQLDALGENIKDIKVIIDPISNNMRPDKSGEKSVCSAGDAAFAAYRVNLVCNQRKIPTSLGLNKYINDVCINEPHSTLNAQPKKSARDLIVTSFNMFSKAPKRNLPNKTKVPMTITMA